MSQAQLPNELATFLENWTTDPNNAKDAFVRFKDFLLTTPDVRFDFKARPGVSYSLRAANAKNDERPLFVLVDVVDDEPEARWLSVCFYADMVNDPDELGDFVPSEITPGTECRTAPPHSGRDLSAHKGGRPQRQACSLFAGKPFPAGMVCRNGEAPPSFYKEG